LGNEEDEVPGALICALTKIEEVVDALIQKKCNPLSLRIKSGLFSYLKKITGHVERVALCAIQSSMSLIYAIHTNLIM